MSPRQLLRRKRKRGGQRRLLLEQLEGRYAMDASLAADFFELKQNGAQLSLDVLANDTFTPDYAGDRLITSVSYGSEGGRLDLSADRQRVLYTPPADFFGTESFIYAVDGEFTAQVTVSLQSPLTFDEFNVLPSDHERVLNVLANDPFWAGYQGPRRITSVSVGSQGGTIRIGNDGQSIIYTPPGDGVGEEHFLYVVDDIYPAQVKINIAATVLGDNYEIIQNTSEHVFNVLANDPFWEGYTGERRITHVVGVTEGATAQIAADGKSISYTPAPGRSGSDMFRYVVDGKYEATVEVRIYRPVQNDWFNVDAGSTAFFYNLTENDWYYDSNNVRRGVVDRVTSVTQPTSGGTVTISADGRGVYYSPAAGFTGTDTFTYLADGVHEATVSVYVTRPVRDDGLSAVQDTSNLTLDVLANDFVGNGYTGARRITSVGATQNGGTVTIRSDGKAIFYTPAAGYVGSDEFTYVVDGGLEAKVYVSVNPLANDDYYRFAPEPGREPYSLHVFQNDRFHFGYLGPKLITSVEVVGSTGTAIAGGGGGRILFTPQQAGWHTLRYKVDGKYEASVSVWIANHLGADLAVVDENSASQQIAVMQNDFVPSYYGYEEFPPQNYQGPRKITGVSAAQQGGTVTFDAATGTVSYTPSLDFYGRDTFTYTVDGFMTTTVSVEVIRRVRDDLFRVDAADGTQALPVLVNDLFGANYSGVGRITSVTSTSNGGTATIAADGKSILYTPAAGFAGTETFTYKVDGRLTAEVSVVVNTPRDEQLPKFESAEEYAQFLIDDALERYNYLFGLQGGNWYNLDTGYTASAPEVRGHSETNVQVAGVDEGDIVEFDDDYVYMLTDGDLVILDAWPADEMSIASRLDIEGKPTAMFLHGDRLTVISEVGGGYWYNPAIEYSSGLMADSMYWPGPRQPSSTIVTVIDVSDRTAPEVVQKTKMEGKYVDSRGVGDFVYVLVDNFNAVGGGPIVVDDGDPTTLFDRYETKEEFIARVTANIGEYVEAALPSYSTYDGEGELVRTGLLNGPENVYKPLVENATNLISVVSFNVESDEPGITDTSAVYGTGASAIYASLDNFYVFDRDYSQEDGALTRIMKFDWDSATGGIDFAATTTVAGTIINQFSADESGEYLRIATTVSNNSSGNWSNRSENTLFVLREDDGVFEFVGSLQNLALNETMRSVRFLGDRAFVTTARTIDPLYAIDLTDPTRPEAIGHITLPGFTSYVHPIGENFLLTVGKNTPNGGSGPTQVSIFDVSNLNQPRRVAEYTFERFSFSEAEVDHHAFGYFAEHGLLAMPTRRIYFERIDTDGDGYRETRQQVEDNELAVFRIDVTASSASQRLQLVSEIAHDSPVRRSGYIGDKLYSIAGDSVKVVDVGSPGVVIADVEIPPPAPDEPLFNPVIFPGVIDLASYVSAGRVLNAVPTPAERTAQAIENARKHLAARIGKSDGAPLLVTAEATPDAPGGGFNLVFRIGETEYLVRASEAGLVQLVDDSYEFAGGGAWHSVDVEATRAPGGIAGDYDLDGEVSDADRVAWKRGYGTISLVSYHAADGNRDGIVDAADYTLWRMNQERVVGDFNGDGAVDQSDYRVWKSSFGDSVAPGTGADATGDGRVDGSDYTVWRSVWESQGAGATLATMSMTSFAESDAPPEAGSGSRMGTAVERVEDTSTEGTAAAEASKRGRIDFSAIADGDRSELRGSRHFAGVSFASLRAARGSDLLAVRLRTLRDRHEASGPRAVDRAFELLGDGELASERGCELAELADELVLVSAR